MAAFGIRVLLDTAINEEPDSYQQLNPAVLQVDHQGAV